MGLGRVCSNYGSVQHAGSLITPQQFAWSLSFRYIHVRRTASHSGGPEALKQTQLTTVTLAYLLNAPVKI
jgi:hypothetical protein